VRQRRHHLGPRLLVAAAGCRHLSTGRLHGRLGQFNAGRCLLDISTARNLCQLNSGLRRLKLGDSGMHGRTRLGVTCGVITRVDLDQQIAFLNHLIVGDVYLRHMPCHLRAHLDDVPLDKGIVGPLVGDRIIVVGHAIERADGQQDNGRREQEQALPRGFPCLDQLLRLVVGWLHSCVRARRRPHVLLHRFRGGWSDLFGGMRPPRGRMARPIQFF
jgi:hypothetical protein